MRRHSFLVLDAAVLHAVSVHGHENTPELREQIRQMLKYERDSKKSPRIAIRGDFFESRSYLSICLICSRNSGVFSCPCTETACSTAASSTRKECRRTAMVTVLLPFFATVVAFG